MANFEGRGRKKMLVYFTGLYEHVHIRAATNWEKLSRLEVCIRIQNLSNTVHTDHCTVTFGE